ncbi:carboxyl transferase domain-containing protein [Micromonosporaceae bacterium Da 78-11]
MTVLDTAISPRTPGYVDGRVVTLERLAQFEEALEQARSGGGEKAVTRHHARGKLLPRERVEMLLDQDSPFLELSPVAAWGTELPPGAGVVTGIGVVEGVECVVVANDPTVAGGAVNAYSMVKIRRAARIAAVNRLPLVALVESAGEAEPEGPPDGGIARDMSRLAAGRVPTVCVVFGATVGDAAYLPALADYTIMVRGHAKMLTIHPQPVRDAVNGRPAPEVRSTPTVPAGVTGPADQLAEDERDGLRLARQCVRRLSWRKRGPQPRVFPPAPPKYDADDLLMLAGADPATPFDPREVLARILDGSEFDEFKPAQGTGLVAGWGELHGYPVGVLAGAGTPGTLADTQKAVHFIQLANATDTSLLFIEKHAVPEEHSAPLVHAMTSSTLPHLILTIGGTAAGASRTDEPRFVFSWPTAGTPASGEEDGIIDPRDTRTVLGLCLSAVHSAPVEGAGHVGVFRPGKVDQ